MTEALRKFSFAFQVAAVFAAACLRPQIGLDIQEVLPLSDICVIALFLISGFSLDSRELFRELGNVRIHVFIHVFAFILFPLAVFGTSLPFNRFYGGQLTLGLYLLAVMPITISSCVALTTISGGNRAAALFNSVSANLLGIVLSPVLFRLMARIGNLRVDVDALAVLLKLLWIVIVPFAAGQILRYRPSARVFADHHGTAFSRASIYIILLIIYLGFCGTVTRMRAQTAGGGIGITGLAALGAYLLVLNAALLAGIRITAHMTGFGKEDRIALYFCAPQKTLALGLPMIISICENAPDLSIGILSLPLIIYHPIQLIVASVIKDWDL